MAISSNIIEILMKMSGADTAAKDTKSFSDKLDSMGKTAMKAGGILTGAVTTPLLLIGKNAVTAASDLEESSSKVGVVFGDMAGEIYDFASTAADSYGMTEEAALAAMGTYGNLFKSMGLGNDATAEMSTGLVALAADLASFNNMDPTEVLDKLRAGLTGETEPLKSLGVNLNAATVEAKAMEMGLMDVGGELTAAAKAQATYALVMEQTTLAQGDFARTSDGLANQQRILSANIGDLMAQLGAVFLPLVQQVTTALNGLVTWFMSLDSSVQTIILVVLAVIAAIGPLILIIGALMSAFATIMPVITAVGALLSGPIILIIGLVVAAIALLTMAWKNNWGGIQEKTQAVVEFIKNLINLFLTALRNWWAQHGQQVMSIINNLWNTAKAVFNTAVGIIKALISGFLNLIMAWWNAHGATVMALVNLMWNTIKTIFTTVISIIKSIFAAFKAAFEGDWRAFGENLRTAWDTLWQAIRDILSNIWETIVSIVKDRIEEAKTIIGNTVENIKQIFTNTDWGALGKGIIEGIKNGIVSAADKLAQAAIAAAKAALDAVKGFLGIQSPSKVFAEIGKQSMAGMALGIAGAQGMPVSAAIGATSNVVRTTQNYFNVSVQGVGSNDADRISSSVRVLRQLYG